MDREYSVMIEQDEEGWFIATVPELRGCHTQAKSLDQLMRRVREAIEVMAEPESGSRGKKPGTTFVGVQRVRVKA